MPNEHDLSDNTAVNRECEIIALCGKGPRRLSIKIIELRDDLAAAYVEAAKARIDAAESELKIIELSSDHGAAQAQMERDAEEMDAQLTHIKHLKRLLNARRFDANTLYSKFERTALRANLTELRELIDSWPYMEVDQ